MSRFNRKGATTKGGKRRITRDKNGKAVPAKSVAMSGNPAFTARCAANGITPTRRQESKFRNKCGALYQKVGR